MPKQCSKCSGDLDRRNKSGICKICAPVTGAAAQSAAAPKITITEGIAVEGDRGVLRKITDQKVRTLQDLIRVCEIDTNEWDVERWEAGAYQQGSAPRAVGKSKNWRRDSADVIVTQLFTIKAYLKRKVAVLSAREEIAELKALAKQDMPLRADGVVNFDARPHMLELMIPDLHLGKLAWGKETGHGNYDSTITKRIFETAVLTLLERTAHFTFDKIVFPIGNDFFHADNKKGTTTMGTQLDTDARFQRTFLIGRNLMIWAIELLRQKAPVEVVVVPGNHDQETMWHLGDSLECYYHATIGVTIRNEPTLRKYVEWGRNMILFTHGDRGGRANLPLLMATEQKEMFGRTDNHEAHTGHIHETRVQEHKGVRVRVIPALCAADAWHSAGLWVGSKRSAEAFVWHETEGIVSTAVYTVAEENRGADSKTGKK